MSTKEGMEVVEEAEEAEAEAEAASDAALDDVQIHACRHKYIPTTYLNTFEQMLTLNSHNVCDEGVLQIHSQSFQQRMRIQA